MRIQGETVLKTIQLAGERRIGQMGMDPGAGGTTLRAFLGGLSHQELIELMAVMSVGRGDPGTDDFQTLVNNIHLSAARIVDYLMEKPYLGQDLEKGMGKLGLSINRVLKNSEL
jgi:hypothetical protein